MDLIKNGVHIVSADAKDLFLANYSNDRCSGYAVKYKSGDNKGQFNTRRFINKLDYSLDLIKLQEVYEKVQRRMDFYFSLGDKDYCRWVINVTFKYAVKEYNRFFGNIYIKFGYTPDDIRLEDNIYIKDGELIAIKVGSPVDAPVASSVLGAYFQYDEGVYKTNKTMKVLYTVAQLREKLYKDGFVSDGVVYRRFKRSSGSSRVGKCLFIDERLYPRMHKWEMCGLKIKEGDQTDLAALEAYIALTMSSIIDTIPLRPENFLVIDDYKSVFTDKVIAVRVGDGDWLESKPEDVKVENSIWDGQSLIDKSAMGDYDDYGMILLRNRFFKSACFNTNIQQFFTDHGVNSVSQLNGFTLAKDIKDIKIITTPSSIKYVKFGALENWLRMLEDDGNFGVVKHEKPTHFFDGRMVQIHYQLLNSLQMTQEEVDELVKPSLDYLQLIWSDPAVLRHYIHYLDRDDPVRQAQTMNDVVYQMLGVTDRFADTGLCYEFKHDISKSYRKNLRRGHILVDGNYSTLLGNPIEMLLSSIGRFDGSSVLGVGNVYSTRFPDGQTLLGSRSPHITAGDILLATNRLVPEIEEYCNTTNEIVCINSINENILMRLSGCDFDSDTILLTDNQILIEAAKRNYDKFLVPTSLVDAKKTVRHYTREDMADLDIKTSVNKIGEIVNLSQELNTRMWHMLNAGASFSDIMPLYCDISNLSILSGIEIDKAKKEFAVDSVAEIKKLRKKYLERDEKDRKIKPNFFGKIARMKGYYDPEHKNYKFHETTMDYLQHSINKFKVQGNFRVFTPFSDLIREDIAYDKDNVYKEQVDRIIRLAREMRAQIQNVWSNSDSDLDNATKAAIAEDIRDEFTRYIKTIHVNKNTTVRLLRALDNPANKDVARSLFYLLFSLPNDSFVSVLNQERGCISMIERADGNGSDLQIFGQSYQKTWL